MHVCPDPSTFFLVGGSGYETGNLKILQASMHVYTSTCMDSTQN